MLLGTKTLETLPSMAQISKPFKKQLSEVHLNVLCCENAELKICGASPLHCR